MSKKKSLTNEELSELNSGATGAPVLPSLPPVGYASTLYGKAATAEERKEIYDAAASIMDADKPLPRVKNWLNAHEFPPHYEYNSLPSLTIPDEVLSLREMVERYARGLPVSGFTPVYDESSTLDTARLELTDRMEIARQTRAELDAYQEEQRIARVLNEAESIQRQRHAMAAQQAEQNAPAPPANPTEPTTKP